MRLIVNGDDLGLSEAVNRETFALMDAGLVTSSSIMAAGNANTDLPADVAARPHVSFGVHLNLTELSPVSGPKNLEPLLGEEGMFCNNIRATSLSWTLLRAIHREFCAQVETVRGLGVRISHADSHHHIHTIPGLLPVIKDVLRRCNIPAVRLTKNLYAPQDRISPLLVAKKAVFNLALTRIPGLGHTDYFTNLPGLLDALPRLAHRNASAEVMVHAGDNSPKGREEHALLRSIPEQYPNVQFITYWDLNRLTK